MNRKIKSFLMKISYPIAKNFIAGENVKDALLTASRLNTQGFTAIINFLGEDVKTPKQAEETANVYLYLLEKIHKRNLKARISVKPSQLGLQINPLLYFDNLKEIGKKANALGIPLEIDIEHLADLNDTFKMAIYLKETLPQLNLRQAVQLRLKRTPADIYNLNEAGVKIRLCKGAYRDDKSVMTTEEIAKSRMIRCAEDLALLNRAPAFATLDKKLIKKFRKMLAENHPVLPRDYEIQLLYGFRKRLAKQFVAEKTRCAIYIPFGSNWLPYGLRRFKYIVKKFPAVIWDEIMMLFEK